MKSAVALFPHVLRRARVAGGACIAVLACLGTFAHAQSSPGKVTAVTPVAPPAARASGAPAPGLPSPSGLRSQFPAGLTAATIGIPRTETGTGGGSGGSGTGGGGGTTGGNGNAGSGGDFTPPATNVMGAGAPQPWGVGPGPYTVVDAARSFLLADANRDGELSRAEARRLSLGQFAFEELDADHDGVVTRWEYDDAMSP
jgi:hypothetical protein